MGKTVLLVEDEPHIIEALTFLLEREGWSVTAHSDGGDAVEQTARMRPDLLILDVMLPNKSGLDILKDIRERPDIAALPVLMLTAKGQDKDRKVAEDLGVDAFITKPFSNREVIDCVRGLARR